MGILGQKGKADTHLHEVEFYASEAEAAQNLRGYLSAPKHLSHLRKFVQWNPIRVPTLRAGEIVFSMNAEVRLPIGGLPGNGDVSEP